MELTDWIIVLAIALILVAFFCTRHTASRSLTDRARHARGTRLLVQATIALWAALMTVERSLTSPGGVPFGLNLRPHVALAAAALFACAGCLWSIRGRQLLKQRRMFGTW
ncbi:hypothetical protein [Paraburkholderia caballeronis]|uniref:Uncharacterized protein n=1 Tax=Paraburkholderia caballeronis TaxID=416943 RepID=A0A1H7K4N7_9BURK|nr:hypothetical protein [Paraburkholderia caballeronis]PXW27127.1 hypothetical protein C7403_10332 [Paraburkholderia caballeronis]PXX02601.1 hypothetical protein C7407_10332 [Paraburkholderia caballeronis]RAK03326.1 hypothetical protein C7409_10332 [Paraburkholderia caballeronis]TDV36130.1 hypothetical protein C7405_10431 [Paraburkholderia caballeronis]SEC47539.1 hypothetical protein SAMN05445871_2283 [Paraburkholderia caballeronis]